MSSWKQCSVESLWRGSAVHPAYIRAIFRHLRTSAETKVLDKSWLMNLLTFECEMAHMHNSKAEAERTGESHRRVSKWRQEKNWWRSWEKVKRTHEYSVYVKQGDVHFKLRRTNVETQEDIISFPACYGQVTIIESTMWSEVPLYNHSLWLNFSINAGGLCACKKHRASKSLTEFGIKGK